MWHAGCLSRSMPSSPPWRCRVTILWLSPSGADLFCQPLGLPGCCARRVTRVGEGMELNFGPEIRGAAAQHDFPSNSDPRQMRHGIAGDIHRNLPSGRLRENNVPLAVFCFKVNRRADHLSALARLVHDREGRVRFDIPEGSLQVCH